MKYQLINRVFECWQVPTTVETEACPIPAWVMKGAIAGATNINSNTAGQWLVSKGDQIHHYTPEEFREKFEPWQEPQQVIAEPSAPPTEELCDWEIAKIRMRGGIRITHIDWPPSDYIEWDDDFKEVRAYDSHGVVPARFTNPSAPPSKVWRVWTEPAKPTEEPLEPFNWDDAEHLLKAGHKIRKNKWRPGIFISMSEGKPRLWRNGAGEPFHPSDASLKIWILA